jgi:hypothetical protein
VVQGLQSGAGAERVCKPPWGGVVSLPAPFCTAAALRTILTQAVRFGTCWKTLTPQERHELQPHVLSHSAAAGVSVTRDMGVSSGSQGEEEQSEWFLRAIDKRCARSWRR